MRETVFMDKERLSSRGAVEYVTIGQLLRFETHGGELSVPRALACTAALPYTPEVLVLLRDCFSRLCKNRRIVRRNFCHKSCVFLLFFLFFSRQFLTQERITQQRPLPTPWKFHTRYLISLKFPKGS